ncbi:MAG: ArgE/DapE family deacylase [Clostridiaceae bacterium]|mgnify:CR=1 FL=1|jgi:acetylornithine deacetylase|nr:ArgE/DapE family deacylase [Clostridiaceae bacterium]
MTKADIINYIEQNKEEAIALLQHLVRINSAVIEHGIDGKELQAQLFLRDRLEKMGATTELMEPDYERMKDSPECPSGHNYKGRPNLEAIFKGVGGGRSLLLTGHVDTMDPGDINKWKHDPWSAHIEDGNLYGLGSADMKAGLCAQLFALEAVLKHGKLKGDCVYLSVVDEEGGGNGTLDYTRRADKPKCDGAIIAEPTNGEIHIASRGVMLLHIDVVGQTGHPLYKWELHNAVEKALIIKKALDDLEHRWLATKCHPVMPSPGITLCMISAGTSGTAIPDRCRMSFQVDMLPVEKYWNGEPREINGLMIRAEVQEAINWACASDPWLSEHPPILDWYQHVDPHSTDPTFELIHVLAENSGAPIGASFAGNDARHLANAGVPSILYGPGYTADIHKPNEKVSISDYIECIKNYASTLVDWCGVEFF